MTKPRLLFAALAIVLIPGSVQGQRRADLLAQARAEFDDAKAIQLLVSAQAPSLGAPDSLWAVVTHELAAALIRQQQRTAAGLWLRWAARHGSQWRMDNANYPPAVVSAFDDAARTVRADSGDFVARTTWRWPARFDATAAGRVEAKAVGSGVPLAVAVAGASERRSTAGLALAARTYDLLVTADGYEPARITREVLPGVTTMLEVDLVPVLAPDVRASASERLIGLRYTRAGQQACASGLIAAADGLVLTSYSISRGADRIDVLGTGGREIAQDVKIAASDADRDLAVIKLTASPVQPLRAVTSLAERDYAWALYRSSCDAVTVARTRVASWDATRPDAVSVFTPLPEASRGGLLIDRQGLLIGLVNGPNSITPIAAAQAVLDQARRPVVVAIPDSARNPTLEPPPVLPPPQLSARKKFPWLLVVGGGAAAGLAAALLGGGGGNTNGNTPPPPPPTTGGIIITFPN